MLTKNVIQTRSPRALNHKLEAQHAAKPGPDGKRRSPKKKVMPVATGVVRLRIDAKTTVSLKPGAALQAWLNKYPNATVL